MYCICYTKQILWLYREYVLDEVRVVRLQQTPMLQGCKDLPCSRSALIAKTSELQLHHPR